MIGIASGKIGPAFTGTPVSGQIIESEITVNDVKRMAAHVGVTLSDDDAAQVLAEYGEMIGEAMTQAGRAEAKHSIRRYVAARNTTVPSAVRWCRAQDSQR